MKLEMNLSKIWIKKEILLSCQNSKNLNSCYNCDEILTKLEKIMLMQSITVCLRVKPKADLTFKGKNALYYNTNLLCK